MIPLKHTCCDCGINWHVLFLLLILNNKILKNRKIMHTIAQVHCKNDYRFH